MGYLYLKNLLFIKDDGGGAIGGIGAVNCLIIRFLISRVPR